MPVTIASGLGKVSGLALDSQDNVLYYLDFAKNSLMKVIPGKTPETVLTDLRSPRQLSYRPQSRYFVTFVLYNSLEKIRITLTICAYSCLFTCTLADVAILQIPQDVVLDGGRRGEGNVPYWISHYSLYPA